MIFVLNLYLSCTQVSRLSLVGVHYDLFFGVMAATNSSSLFDVPPAEHSVERLYSEQRCQCPSTPPNITWRDYTPNNDVDVSIFYLFVFVSFPRSAIVVKAC